MKCPPVGLTEQNLTKTATKSIFIVAVLAVKKCFWRLMSTEEVFYRQNGRDLDHQL